MVLLRVLVFLLLALTSLAAAPTAELVVQTGLDDVKFVAFSPDGRLIITAGDNVAVLWDAATGVELRVFSGHSGLVNSAVFSPNGKFVMTASMDGTVRVWETATGKEVRRIIPPSAKLTIKGQIYPGFPGVKSAVFSSDGNRILTGGEDGRARLWDANSGRLLAEFSTVRGNVLASSGTCVAFAPDGTHILTGVSNRDVQLWDVNSGREIGKIEGHQYPKDPGLHSAGDGPGPVAFSADGRSFVANGPDMTPRLWEATPATELRRFPVISGGCGSLSLSRDGTHIATSGNVVQVWNAANGNLVVKLPRRGNFIAGPDGRVVGKVEVGTTIPTSVALSPDGRTLVVGEAFQGSTLWDVNSGQLIRKLESRAGRVSSISFSADGRQMVANGPQLWDLKDGGIVQQVPGSDYPAAISPVNPRTLLLSVLDNMMLYDVEASKLLLKFEDPVEGTDLEEHHVGSVLFSPNGRQILTTGGRFNGDRSILLWNAATGKLVTALQHDPSDFESFATAVFSADGGEILSAGSDRIVRLWEAASGRELLKLEPYEFTPRSDWVKVWSYWDWAARTETRAVAFSPDGKKLFTAGPFGVRIWDRATGKEMRRIDGPGSEATSIAVSPDGKSIVTGGSDGILHYWDPSSGRKIQESTGHSGGVAAIVFVPGGDFVASASDDGTVRLWSAAGGKLVATMVSFSGGGWAVVDPRGRFDTNSLDGNAALRWIVSDEPFRPLPIEIFTRQYYTPKLLARILSKQTLPEVKSIAEINRLQSTVSEPVIEPDPIDPNMVRVRVRVANQTDGGKKSGMQDLRIFRNGQMVGLQKGLLEEREYVFNGIRLPHDNPVMFSAYAFNSDLVKSDTVRTTYRRKDIPGPAKHRTYVLNVGVNQTKAANCQLGYAVSDATHFGETLQAALPSVTRKLLTSDGIGSSSATKESIRMALAEVAKEVGPDDIFVMTFASHGFIDNDRFYLFPSDLEGDCNAPNNPRLLASAISADELAKWLTPVDAGEMVLIVDACRSAASIESGGFRPAPLGIPGLGQLAYDKRIRLLAASQSRQDAAESKVLKMGVLAYALVVEGLEQRRADWQPADGKIYLQEWLKYGQKRVPSLYAKMFSESNPLRFQTPVLFDFSLPGHVGSEMGQGQPALMSKAEDAVAVAPANRLSDAPSVAGQQTRTPARAHVAAGRVPADTLTGRWTYDEVAGWKIWGKTDPRAPIATVTLELRADGKTLTGAIHSHTTTTNANTGGKTVSAESGAVNISNGRIDGNDLSFDLESVIPSLGIKQTTHYTGTLDNDTIHMTRSRYEGDFTYLATGEKPPSSRRGGLLKTTMDVHRLP